MRARAVLSLVASLACHLTVVGAMGIEWPEPTFEDDPVESGPEADGANVELAGKAPDGEATDELVEVAVHVLDEAPPAPPAPPPPPAAPVAPVPKPVAKADATAAAEAAGNAAPQADASPAPKPPRKAVRRTSAPNPVHQVASAAQRRAPLPPCEPPPEQIAKLDDTSWSIERALVEFYATHINELLKQGSVWTHKGKDGKPDGFKVGLTRCSIVKQAGLKSGDIVHRINDRAIATIPQAIAAYFDLRNEPVLEVYITRAGKPLVFSYELEQPDTKEERREMRRTGRKELRRELKERGAGT